PTHPMPHNRGMPCPSMYSIELQPVARHVIELRVRPNAGTTRSIRRVSASACQSVPATMGRVPTEAGVLNSRRSLLRRYQPVATTSQLKRREAIADPTRAGPEVARVWRREGLAAPRP